MITINNDDEFQRLIFNIYKNDITIISPYTSLNDNIIYQCNKCKTIYTISAKQLLFGKCCIKCDNIPNHYSSYTTQTTYEKTKTIFPNIEILGHFRHTRNKILLKCTNCNHIWLQSLATLWHGKGCPQCQHKKQKLAMTDQEFKEKIYKINPNITLLSEFKGTHKHVYYRCNICHREKRIIVYELLNGVSCNHHDQLSYNKGLSSIDFQHKLINKYPDIKIINNSYISKNKLATFQCNKCNHIFTQSANVVLKYGCPNCDIVTSQAILDKFNAKLYSLYKNQIKNIEPYRGSQVAIHYQCDKNHIFKASYKEIMSNIGCKICNKQNNHILERNEDFNNKLKIITNDSIIALDTFQSTEIKMRFQCKKCGHTWYTMPTNIIHKKCGCPNCDKINKQLSSIEIQRKIQAVYPDNHIKLVSQYINLHSKQQYFCNKCQQYFYKSLAVLVTGAGCPNCDITNSHGEHLIQQYLIQHNVPYIKEFSFKDCKYKNPLRFDFVVFNDSFNMAENNIKFIIEYDGKHHYSINGCRSKDNKRSEYLGIRIRDHIKNEFCKKHNIILIRLRAKHKNKLKFQELLYRELEEKLASHNIKL